MFVVFITRNTRDGITGVIRCGMKLLIHCHTATVEDWEWISNFNRHFTGHVITYPCCCCPSCRWIDSRLSVDSFVDDLWADPTDVDRGNKCVVQESSGNYFSANAKPLYMRELLVKANGTNIPVNLIHWGRVTHIYVSKLPEAETKWSPFSRRHFQMHFLGSKCIDFDKDFTEFCSKGSK